jgi:hypothetical protein
MGRLKAPHPSLPRKLFPLHSVFPGDLFDLEPGRLFCADPGDVTKIDALVDKHRPAVAIIDPPNGQVGRDLLTYLVALHIPRIICWRADLYPGTVSQNRKGHWIAWEPTPLFIDPENPYLMDTRYAPGLLAYHYGGDGRRPLILHGPAAQRGVGINPGVYTHTKILQGHPDYRPGQAALLCYDRSEGEAVIAVRGAGLLPLVIEPDVATCVGILDTLGRFDAAGVSPGTEIRPQGREYSRRQGV